MFTSCKTTESTDLRKSLGAAFRSESGAATAEYAIATLAAVAFAGLLLAILKSDQVKEMLFNLIENALTPAG